MLDATVIVFQRGDGFLNIKSTTILYFSKMGQNILQQAARDSKEPTPPVGTGQLDLNKKKMLLLLPLPIRLWTRQFKI
ncbi:hypothetical protein ACHAXS_002815 [Conticribra weissflogii]